MEQSGIRERLQAAVAAAREREHELLALSDDSPPPEPGLWTVKDHLAHLNEPLVRDAGREERQTEKNGGPPSALVLVHTRHEPPKRRKR